MRPIRMMIVTGVLMASWTFIASEGQSQTKKEDAPSTTKSKGQIPPGWKALDLTASQKDEVYKIQADFRAKIDKLEDEIKKLKAEQAMKLADVLTVDQKKKLISAIEGGTKEPSKKEAKKEAPKDAPKDAPKESPKQN